MGLIDKGISNVTGIALSRKVKAPSYKANDFQDGFIMLEYEDGRAKPADKVVLTGPFMPHQPFTFGGEQRLNSQYYPGNSEPSVQVLGSKEKTITIKGELKLKKFKRQFETKRQDGSTFTVESDAARTIAQEYQQLIDAMRIRGNLVYLEMGEWHRWGFIESCSFDLYTLTRISYEITFMIVGFNQPRNCKIIDKNNSDLIAPNKDLTNAALAAISQMRDMPAEMPATIAERLNDEISKVATAIGLVTGFVDDVLSNVEQLQASVNRAIGLVKNARATISSSIRRINAISNSISSLGSSVVQPFEKTTSTIKNANHIHKVRSDYAGLSALLASMGASLAALRATTPMFRHKVVNGDTLQKISLKYYNTADYWDKIYQHNNLTTTQLTAGAVLEIPKV